MHTVPFKYINKQKTKKTQPRNPGVLAFFCSTQWKMKMNMPCRELKMVKR